MNEQPPTCYHPDCLNVSHEDAARLNVTPQPMVFPSQLELVKHALEKHGIRLKLGGKR